jgi:hypothetical protein
MSVLQGKADFLVVINLKTAKAMGVTAPTPLLGRATR